MIIDAHTHGIHAESLDKLADIGGSWAKKTLSEWFARMQNRKPHAIDAALRIEQLDRNDIDLQVVTPFGWMDANNLPADLATKLAYSRATNDGMAKFADESKGRLVCGGSVPLEGFEQGGRQEMERAIKTLGLKVISIPSNIGGKPVDLPEFEPFWAQAAEMGIAVWIHPVGPAGVTDRSYEAEYDLIHNLGWPFETQLMLHRLVFSGIMERYPTLNVISHHLGGGLPFLMSRTEETYAALRKIVGSDLPRPLYDYFSRFYYDTAIGGSAPAIRCTYEVFGADQIIFATDAPYGPGTGEERLASYPKIIKSLNLPATDNKKIFEDNARKIIKFD
ncbi:amidohydrolase family protein [Chloroflexota bacterium]